METCFNRHYRNTSDSWMTSRLGITYSTNTYADMVRCIYIANKSTKISILFDMETQGEDTFVRHTIEQNSLQFQALMKRCMLLLWTYTCRTGMTKRNGFYFINRPSKPHCLGTVSYESVVRAIVAPSNSGKWIVPSPKKPCKTEM